MKCKDVSVSVMLCRVCINTDCYGALEVRVSAGREKGVIGDRSTDGYHVPFVLGLIKALLIKAVDEGRERESGENSMKCSPLLVRVAYHVHPIKVVPKVSLPRPRSLLLFLSSLW